MRLLKRIRHILSASLNDLLDGLEDPQTMLHQLLRDMETSIRQLRQEVQAAIARRHLVQQRLAKAREEVDKWQANAKLAVDQGREELARQALLKKHQAADDAAALATQLSQAADQVAELKEDLRAMEDKIQEARRKQETLLSRRRQPVTKQPQDIIKGFEQFARCEDELNRQAAIHESVREVREHDLDQQFETIRREKTIDEELEKLKKK